MLDQIPVKNMSTDLVRLASYRDIDEFFADQRLDASSAEEVRRLLESRGIATKPREPHTGVVSLDEF